MNRRRKIETRNLLFVAALVLLQGAPVFPRSASDRDGVDFEAMAFEAGAVLGESGEVRLQQTPSAGLSRNTKIVLGVVAVGALVFMLYYTLAVRAVLDAVPEAGETGLGAESLPASPR